MRRASGRFQRAFALGLAGSLVAGCVLLTNYDEYEKGAALPTDTDASLDAGADQVGIDAPSEASDGSADGSLPGWEVLAETQAEVGRLALNSSWVYYIVGKPYGEVRRVPKRGGPSETVGSTASVTDLALGSDGVVFVNGYTGGPYAFSSGAKQLLPKGCAIGLGVNTRGDDVYYTLDECNGAPEPMRVLRASLGDASVYTLLGEVDAGKSAAEHLGNIAVTASELFVAGADGLYQVDLALTTATLVSSHADQYVALAVDGDSLYLRSITKLERTSRLDLSESTVLGGGTVGVTDLVARAQVAIDGEYVYYTAADGVYRAVKSGVELATRVVAASNVVGVAVDAENVYFSAASEKRIYRYSKTSID